MVKSLKGSIGEGELPTIRRDYCVDASFTEWEKKKKPEPLNRPNAL